MAPDILKHEMIEYLKLEGVGPASELEVEFAPRLNLITGDNGLGKSFLLDIAWWALTETWASLPVAPLDNSASEAKIRFGLRTGEVSRDFKSEFYRLRQDWREPRDEPEEPGDDPRIVIYAKADGGFSVWDSVRNTYPGTAATHHYYAYHFDAADVWDGLAAGGSRKKICNGLILDWASWQREKSQAFEQLTRVLRQLSPSPEEPLEPGRLRRVALDDVRDHPTLKMPYAQDVPLLYASAGIRRVVALSYLLVWAWQEHLRASELVGTKPAKQIFFLVDEIEAHLHPQWQRRVVPALLDVMGALGEDAVIPVQLLATTHSPLVLVSIEPGYDDEKDALFELDLVKDQVVLERSPWRRRGDVNKWLSSSIFDLGEPRSLAAEQAMDKARELLRGPNPELQDIEKVDEQLRAVLSEDDRFWIRWSSFVDGLRGAA